jgi:hypothetical protein
LKLRSLNYTLIHEELCKKDRYEVLLKCVGVEEVITIIVEVYFGICWSYLARIKMVQKYREEDIICNSLRFVLHLIPKSNNEVWKNYPEIFFLP